MTDVADTPPAKSFRTEVAETIRTLGLGLLIALGLRIVLFEPFTIPLASMEPGLLVGDYVVASKWDYGWSRHSVPFGPPLFEGRVAGREPQRGEVVVFKLPRDPAQTWVKRLMGLPGDRIQVKGGVVFVNGRVVARRPAGEAEDPDAGFVVGQYREPRPAGGSYLTFERGPRHEGDDTGVFVVPEGHYFMMGDNRDNSLDSRWPEAVGVGFVPAENLIGRARVVLVSWKGGASVLKPWTWVLRFDPSRALRPID